MNKDRHSGSKQSSGQDEQEDLVHLVRKLSDAAFELAQQAYAGKGEEAAREAKAQEMNSFLNELVPLIQQSPTDDQATLEQTWTDARLDVGYVLSKGELSTSTRLHHYINNTK